MATKTGTHTIADLAENAFSDTTVVEYGIDKANEAIEADLQAHNARMVELVSDLAIVTTERSTVYGTQDGIEMQQVDEFGRGPTQKPAVGSKVEFPLDKRQVAVGFTWDYFKRMSMQDLARVQIAARKAHVTAVVNAMRNALFGATNYTWVDRLKDNLDLGVKRLVNADSASIPNGPNGEEFDGATETHYLADTTLDADALTALIGDVVEHGHGSQVMVYINRAQEATVRALTGFVAYLDPRIIAATNANSARGTLDITRMDNRAIGVYGGAEIWVKPWVPASYLLAFSQGDSRKPLAVRQSPIASEQGLQLGGPRRTEAHPLMADYYESYFGVGVWTRTNGAVLFIDAGATYEDPSF